MSDSSFDPQLYLFQYTIQLFDIIYFQSSLYPLQFLHWSWRFHPLKFIGIVNNFHIIFWLFFKIGKTLPF